MINETKDVINSTTGRVLTYSVNKVTCGDTGRYTCGVLDEDRNVKNESVIYLMVNECPPKLCHDAPRAQTVKAALNSSAIFTLCLIADKREFFDYVIYINERMLYLYETDYNANFIETSPIHNNVYVTFKNVRPTDYKTYVVVLSEVVGESRRPLMTYTFYLEGIGDKCPIDWCPAKEKKCMYVDGPSPNYNWARDRCQLYGGELVSDHLDDAFITCIADQMKRAKTSSMVAADSSRQCSVVQLEPFSFGAKSSCDTFTDFFFGCQILYWSYRPLPNKLNVEGVRVEEKSGNPLLIGVVVPAAVVALVLAIGPIVIVKIRKGKQTSNSRQNGVSETPGANGGHSISQEQPAENDYEILDDIIDQYYMIKDSTLSSSPGIITRRPMPCLMPGEYITPIDQEKGDNSEHYNVIDEKTEYITPVNFDSCEYITPLNVDSCEYITPTESYDSIPQDLENCEYITPPDSNVMKSVEKCSNGNSLLDSTLTRPPNHPRISPENVIDATSDNLRNSTRAFGDACQISDMPSPNFVGESDIVPPNFSVFTNELDEDCSNINREKEDSGFESTDIKEVDDFKSSFESTNIKEFDDFKSSFESTNIKEVDNFKSSFESTNIKEVDDSKTTFKSTNFKQVYFKLSFESTNIKEVDDINYDFQYSVIDEVDDFKSSFESTNIKEVDDFKSTFESTTITEVDDSKTTFKSTNSKEVDDINADFQYSLIEKLNDLKCTFQSTYIKERDDFNSLTNLKKELSAATSTALELTSSHGDKPCRPSKAIETSSNNEDKFSCSKDSGVMSIDCNVDISRREVWEQRGADNDPVYQQCTTVSQHSPCSSPDDLSYDRLNETFLKVHDFTHESNEDGGGVVSKRVCGTMEDDGVTDVKQLVNDDSEVEIDFTSSDHEYYMLSMKREDHTYWKINC